MRIAIIGSGISGLTAAYLLSDAHEVVVFEAADYIGGHTNTVDVNWGEKTYAVNKGGSRRYVEPITRPLKDNLRVNCQVKSIRLQSIRAPVEFRVSLNLEARVDPSKVIRRMVYHHPVYCFESLAARRRLKEINGANRTYFAGVYWGYGFHQDGVNSALEVCRQFGKGL